VEVSLPRLLFCDYDGEFEQAAVLSKLGFLVDQIRPDGLRSVAVGEHSAYLFVFEKLESKEEVRKICKKLKSAGLVTPIVVVGLTKGFGESDFADADYVIVDPTSESELLDTLDDMVGCPSPNFLRFDTSSSEMGSEKIKSLEDEVEKWKKSAENMNKALEAQRNFYKPKLKALLEGQKLDKHDSELEMLKVKLSEVEAKLLDREARIKELEQMKQMHKAKLEKLVDSHHKAQQSLRSFYQEKIRQISKKDD